MDTPTPGRVAIVTGASRGIGQAIAVRLAAEGVNVAASARTLEPDPRYDGSLTETVDRIRAAGGDAVAIPCDLASADDRRRLVASTVEHLGPVDILVNNAAVTYLLPFTEFPEKRWRLMFEVQVRAPYDLAQLVVPGMRDRKQGWILNITSRAGIHAQGPPYDPVYKQGFTVYGMVKAALDRFTTGLAAELYDDGIAVNSLAPWDNVATPGAGVHDLVEGFAIEGPEWIAEAATALCTGDPSRLTGRVAYSQPLLAELQLRPEGRLMDFGYSAEEEAFRHEVRDWLDHHLVGEFTMLGGGAEFAPDDWKVRVAWEQELGRGGWIGLSWPRAHGGREATAIQELVFAEEYARAHGPTRGGTFGEGLLGPTLIHFGSDAQRARFLPPILRGDEYWCQGFSEPGAGSDLAALSTRARLDGDEWVVDGQKVWTSQAQFADWIFALCRTDADAPKHKGISFLLLPMDQPGIEVRPLVEMTGGDHFCEVFFDGARTPADMIVGAPGDGWRIAMATLGFERGTAFIGQLRRYADEWDRLRGVAAELGRLADPVIRKRFADSYIGLEIMRYGAFRTITSVARDGRPGPEASIGKLQWSQWHQQLGELAVDVLGAAATLRDDGPSLLHEIHHTFLFGRAHTIYAGSSQVQRNIIGERVLGLPKEPGP